MHLFEALWSGVEWLDHGTGWLEALFYVGLVLAVVALSLKLLRSGR